MSESANPAESSITQSSDGITQIVRLVIIFAISMTQVVVGVVFFLKVRKLPGVAGKLPKFMVCWAIVAGLAQLFDWIASLMYFGEDLPTNLLVVLQVLESIPSVLFFSQFLKFYSVQVQLKTSDENTVMIMQKLNRAKYQERLVILFYSIDWISDFMITYQDYLSEQATPAFYNELVIINVLADFIYATFFIVIMIKVNMQLA